MFSRISKSFQLAKDSWAVLMSNKRFLMFPLLTGICCLLVFISFAIPVAALSDKIQAAGNPPIWLYLILFAFYFCSYFVIIFFNAALVSCALMKFNGDDPTLGDGLRAASRRLPQILAWALVSATVGLLLKAIENSHEKAGQIMSMILGTVWTALTYFVVPILVVEQVGPFQAVGRSVSLLKKTWGEAIVGHIGIGLFSFLLFLPVLLLIFVTGFAFAKMGTAVAILLLVVTVIAFLVWSALTSALSGVYLSALYQYAAHERVPEGFDQDTIKGAFYGKG